MTSAQSQLVRCTNCRHDYEPGPFVTTCPVCGGASWVAAWIAVRDENELVPSSAGTRG